MGLIFVLSSSFDFNLSSTVDDYLDFMSNLSGCSCYILIGSLGSTLFLSSALECSDLLGCFLCLRNTSFFPPTVLILNDFSTLFKTNVYFYWFLLFHGY